MNPVVDVMLVLKMFFSLIVVLALTILIVRYGLPYLLKGRTSGQRRLEILEILPLDRQNRLILVRVKKWIYLLATGPEGTRRLDRWKVNIRTQESVKAVVRKQTFQSILHGKWKKEGP